MLNSAITYAHIMCREFEVNNFLNHHHFETIEVN